MTPKEKAQELFDKYFEVTNNYYQAKQCALIAVDEILDTIKWCIGDSQVEYWEGVKKEIEAL
jgi:hypothetical protein